MKDLDLSVIQEQILSTDLVPLLLAIVLGGLIGLEREIHGRPAGLRTHILVCLASAMLVLASRELGDVANDSGLNIVFDPQRLAAGIVTGIGFLGAAAVIKSGDMVRGITTGACVWAVAGIGVVIGGGSYGLACVTTILLLTVLVILDWITSSIPSIRYRRIAVRGQGRRMKKLAAEVRALFKQHKMRVQDLSGSQTGPDLPFELVFHVRCRNHLQAPEMLDELAKLEGVEGVDWSQLAH